MSLRAVRRLVLQAMHSMVALTVSLAAVISVHAGTSNPNASPAAKAVLAYLTSLPQQSTNSLIIGQHVGYTTSYYYSFTDFVPLGYQTFVTPLQQQTGKWLGLIGVDFSTIDPQYSYPLDYSQVTPTLIDHWNKGGLVTVMYTARNPWTGRIANDRSVMAPMSDIVTPGTAANRSWLTQLDSVAAGLQVLRDAGVVVLFRPLHEINGSWFWYAHNSANPTNFQDTIALWRYTHDYLTRVKGLDNLLWVYAAAVTNGTGISDELSFYPGDAWVDIVGIDRYARTFDAATVAGFAKLRARGKPMCLCEMGPTTQASDGTFDYQAFVASEIRGKVADIAYAMAWADYPSGGGKANIALVSNRNAAGLLGDAWTVTADEIPAFNSGGRLANLSTRGQVQTGDNRMIGGFVISGSAPKKVLVTARGPSLTAFGVVGAMANPSLQLVSGQTVIASNDDWGSASNAAEITASGKAPTNALESAILTTLNPGAYTAIVSGVNNGTGVGIVEVFELDRPDVPLTNLSTRGQVQTGDNVMIGGFVIEGSQPRTVLIRANGPSLTAFGVVGALANPTLRLLSGQAEIAGNDDWQAASNAAAIQATGLAPTNPLESAILMTLNPGAYTAIVSGVNGGTGVGIVEVFAR